MRFDGARFYFSVNDGINTDPYIVSFFKQGGRRKTPTDQRFVYGIERSGKTFRRDKFQDHATKENAAKLLKQFLKDNK